MKAAAVYIASAAALGATLASAPADARHRHRRSPPLVEEPMYAPPVYARPLSPADRAKSGYIYGASPYNPEGSSNPRGNMR